MKDLSDFNTRKSPLQKLDIPLFNDLGLEFYIKRDDLLHPLISGNKWRKLKYNLFELERSRQEGIITFGGAYSNHLHAVAATGHEFGFQTVGIVRGEIPKQFSPTLISCTEMGIQKIIHQNESYFLIPEGGANEWALKGCAEILDEITIPFDYFCTACGTGTTLAGLLTSEKKDMSLIGFPVLKGGEFINEEISQLHQTKNLELKTTNYQLKTDYHFGGYAKHTSELLLFIDNFEAQTGVVLEQVYTGKMMFGIFDLAKNGFFRKGSRIIALHTGGLQGKL
jgi:1-aminocyclopropane-1-carboxylate deaminase